MRTLTKAEIEQLQAQHCIATDWSLIEVAEPFHPEYVQEVVNNQSTQTGLRDILLSSANNNYETAQLING